MLGHLYLVRYFLTVVDDRSRHTWLFFMKNKSEIGYLVKSFIAMAATQFGAKVKLVRSNNGSEFKTKELEEFFGERGIIQQYS